MRGVLCWKFNCDLAPAVPFVFLLLDGVRKKSETNRLFFEKERTIDSQAHDCFMLKSEQVEEKVCVKMKISRAQKISIFFFLILLVAAGFIFLKPFQSQARVHPKLGNIVESIYGLGTVSADKVFHLRAGMNLTVEKVYVNEGDLVKAGNPLVKLDENVIRTPISGTVTAVPYKEGELAATQGAVVTVTNLEHLYLEVSLEQQSVLQIKKGQTALISFESLRNEKFEGLVVSVYPRDNQFIVRIELKTWPSGVLPGMTADVAILVGEKANVLLIPVSSLLAGKVTRVRSGKKESVAVRLGVVDGEWGEVISDNISPADELVSRK